MNSDLIEVVVGGATVALIVVATRWLFNSKGAQNPTSRNGANIYGLRWQIRVVSYMAAAFFLFLSIEGFLQDSHLARWTIDLLFVGLAIASLWFGSGVVVTDQNGITKKSLWKSQLLRWDEISHIQAHKRDAGAIELRAGSRKLIVDSRFVAAACLLREIKDRTNLPVARD
ncbi:MAG: hypothetical protein WCC22_10600 [Terriglobales bacterium]